MVAVFDEPCSINLTNPNRRATRARISSRLRDPAWFRDKSQRSERPGDSRKASRGFCWILLRVGSPWRAKSSQAFWPGPRGGDL